jgi:hypothetical protein
MTLLRQEQHKYEREIAPMRSYVPKRMLPGKTYYKIYFILENYINYILYYKADEQEATDLRHH